MCVPTLVGEVQKNRFFAEVGWVCRVFNTAVKKGCLQRSTEESYSCRGAYCIEFKKGCLQEKKNSYCTKKNEKSSEFSGIRLRNDSLSHWLQCELRPEAFFLAIVRSGFAFALLCNLVIFTRKVPTTGLKLLLTRNDKMCARARNSTQGAFRYTGGCA